MRFSQVRSPQFRACKYNQLLSVFCFSFKLCHFCHIGSFYRTIRFVVGFRIVSCSLLWHLIWTLQKNIFMFKMVSVLTNCVNRCKISNMNYLYRKKTIETCILAFKFFEGNLLLNFKPTIFTWIRSV